MSASELRQRGLLAEAVRRIKRIACLAATRIRPADESGGLSESLIDQAKAAYLAILGAARSGPEPEKILARDRARWAAWLKRTRTLMLQATPEEREELAKLVRKAESHKADASSTLRRCEQMFESQYQRLLHLDRVRDNCVPSTGRAARAATNRRIRGSRRGASTRASSRGGDSGDPDDESEPPGGRPLRLHSLNSDGAR